MFGGFAACRDPRAPAPPCAARAKLAMKAATTAHLPHLSRIPRISDSFRSPPALAARPGPRLEGEHRPRARRSGSAHGTDRWGPARGRSGSGLDDECDLVDVAP